MNNSVFGKSIQNQRNQLNLKLCLNESQVKKYISRPNYITYNILDENKAIVQIQKQKVKLNRPIYLGFACLEISKYWMYKSYYKYFKHHYGNDISLLYGDTDSLLFEVKTEDLYMDYKTKFPDIMDLSNFPKDHFIYDRTNEKVIGKFKDEFAGFVIEEFVGLKPKLYSILYNGGKFKNVAKGVQKAVIKKHLNHDKYKDCLFNQTRYNTKVRRIESKGHELRTIETEKQVFQPLDDKRYYLDDGIQSFAFGHYRINSSE